MAFFKQTLIYFSSTIELISCESRNSSCEANLQKKIYMVNENDFKKCKKDSTRTTFLEQMIKKLCEVLMFRSLIAPMFRSVFERISQCFVAQTGFARREILLPSEDKSYYRSIMDHKTRSTASLASLCHFNGGYC